MPPSIHPTPSRWRLGRRRRRIDPALRERRRKSLRDDALNLPNLLTMGRVVIIPLVIYLLDRGTPRDCFYAALVYAAAAITDLLDGYLARRMNIVSVLGKFLDPLADKLLVMASLVWMMTLGRIHAWAVVLLLAREISVTGLRSIASSEGLVIAAGNEGKSKTALQMVGVICLILGYPYQFSLGFYDLGLVDLVVVGRWLIYISLIFSLVSALKYVGLFADALDQRVHGKGEATGPEGATSD